jgi:FHS family L-fucose permease-like MFS transporter
MATRNIGAGSGPSQNIQPAPTPNYARPLAIVTTLFFMWRFLTCLNDILVPHLKSIFDLTTLGVVGLLLPLN